jgi:hypothetical protein
VSAIQQYESGPPAVLDGYQSIPVPLTPSITTSGSRADRVVGVPVRSSTSCRDIRYGDPTNPRAYLFNAGNAKQAAAIGLPLAFVPEGDFNIGNTPNTDPHARQCPVFNEDVSVTKDFPVIKERLKVRFGADFFNLFNRHTWNSGEYGQDVGQSNFGIAQPFQISGPRIVQMHVRVEF